LQKKHAQLRIKKLDWFAFFCYAPFFDFVKKMYTGKNAKQKKGAKKSGHFFTLSIKDFGVFYVKTKCYRDFFLVHFFALHRRADAFIFTRVHFFDEVKKRSKAKKAKAELSFASANAVQVDFGFFYAKLSVFFLQSKKMGKSKNPEHQKKMDKKKIFLRGQEKNIKIYSQKTNKLHFLFYHFLFFFSFFFLSASFFLVLWKTSFLSFSI
jgi:hypothetical protein